MGWTPSSFKRHRFPPEIIRHAVWLYARFTLSYRDVTVRDIYETLRERRKIAYTTVMTMMKIMEGKGQLKKSQAGRAYVYKPTHSRERVLKGMIREFVERVFNGSRKPW